MQNLKEMFRYLAFILFSLFMFTSVVGQDSTYMQIRDGHWYTEVEPDSLTTPIQVLDSIDVVGPERVYDRLTGDTYIWSGVDSTWHKVIVDDSLSGAITARNPYGEMILGADDVLTFAGGSTTALQIDSLVAGLNSQFSVDTATLTYNGTVPFIAQVTYTITGSFPEATTIQANVGINASSVVKSVIQTSESNIDESFILSKSFLIQINPGDDIQLLIAPGTHTGDDDLTVTEANINIIRVD